MIEDTNSMYHIQQKRKVTGTWATLRKLSDRTKAHSLYNKMIQSRKVLTKKNGMDLLPKFRLTKVEEAIILEDEHMPPREYYKENV